MNYQDTVNWMFSQLPMYQNQGASAYKKDLSNTIKLANHLKNPQQNFKSIHVAGTNGKGSTSHMIASVLQEAGYKVGLYTSPHLKDFRERIKINGKEVSQQFVIGFIRGNKLFLEANKLSFFEMTVGLAFDYFSKKNVDVAVVEVGLGGRLDSTNIITPEVSVITNIGFDHTKFLGDTLPMIAKEKAGIIKKEIPVVVGEFQEETHSIFKSVAKQNKSAIKFADQSVDNIYQSDLKGSYQKKNIKTAACAIQELKKRGFKISDKNVNHGFLNVVTNTGLKGRWQVLQEQPLAICDTAHNKEGLTLVMEQLLALKFDKLHIVLGFVNDKDVNAILNLFPKTAQYYFCKPNVVRGLNEDELTQKFVHRGYLGKSYKSVNEAFKEAKLKAKKDDLIYVGGSTFVVAEII